jgi:hypothetical protein
MGCDRRRVGRYQQRVGIRVGLGNVARADGAGAPGAVVHHHGLAQACGQLLADQAAEHIRVTTGWKGHHDGDGLRGVGGRLGPGRGDAGQDGGGQQAGADPKAVA